MATSLRRWGARQLLLAWLAYWLVLAAAVFARPAWIVWQLARDPRGHGNVSAAFGDGGFSLTVTADGVARWTGSASLLAITLWFVVPPLLLVAVWLRARPGRGALPPAPPDDRPTPSPPREAAPALGAGEAPVAAPGRAGSPVAVDRGVPGHE